MDDREFTDYKDSRYKKALKYYDKKAIKNSLLYHFCSIYIIVVAISIAPIITLFPTINLSYLNIDGKSIAALLSPTVAIIAGILSHFKFHENWLSYRATWDALKHELHFRNAKIDAYENAKDRNSLFIERVESLISTEGSEWFARQATKEHLEKTLVKRSKTRSKFHLKLLC